MDSRVKKALKFIDENLDKNLTLKILTKHCCLGCSRFCELFKKETGMTFKNYLKYKRIEKAKELLKDDSLNIKQVSYRVGYKSIPTFYVDFKKLTDLTPSEYKKKSETLIIKLENSITKNS